MKKIIVRGAREHNLKNITVEIPRNKLVVLTGVSGSGKSSFAFDTLYAEGQRRYVESLSAYARQFLGQLEKPLYESIEGLSPAISIEQKSVSHNPRSTVGTVTEIADYLRVLYARAGTPHCPECGREVTRQSAQQMTDIILSMKEDTKVLITAPLARNRKGSFSDLLKELRRKGFVRVLIDGEERLLDSDISLQPKKKHTILLVVDRLSVSQSITGRLFSSVETALAEGDGILSVIYPDRGEEILMSEHNACVYCGISIPELSPQLFSFNNPLGMCRECSGLGFEMKVDPLRVVPRTALSIDSGAVVPWGIPSGHTKNMIRALAKEIDINLGAAWKSYTEAQQDFLLYGSAGRTIEVVWRGKKSRGVWETEWEGVIPRIERLYTTTNSREARKYYEKFFSKTPCKSCSGMRLRKEARAVTIAGKNICDLSAINIREVHSFFSTLKLKPDKEILAGELVREITDRLNFLIDVGLHYLTLLRSAPTLSGGESQRIRLASQIGSRLTGVLYVLDEPTIGLHQVDNKRLLTTLEKLRDLGNTVLVVEHDKETIQAADHIIDFGPGAGSMGGYITATGSVSDIAEAENSVTGDYLAGRKHIDRILPPGETTDGSLFLEGASLHNLKHISVRIPLNTFVCVTGVSGSGKSSLITQTLYPALSAKIGGSMRLRAGPYKRLKGDENIDKIINVSQDPIGRTPRSNPATYTKVFDHIRNLFADIPLSRLRGYKPGRFSFNIKGGRCEECGGAGSKRIEMHFLADVFVECEVCSGKRFNTETLKVTFNGLNIAEVLDLSVAQALKHFQRIPSIYRILSVMKDVGLGYIKLGQSATTLSGGEAQRIKLAKELSKPQSTHTLYILDEPTTGLHLHDVKKLLHVLGRLVRAGNSVVIIEHNLDVIKNAGWIIDLGPRGGDEGGEVVAEGTPEDIASNSKSFTGEFLKEYL